MAHSQNNCAPLLKISKKFLKLTNNILHQHKMLTKISLLQAVTACVRSLFKIVQPLWHIHFILLEPDPTLNPGFNNPFSLKIQLIFLAIDCYTIPFKQDRGIWCYNSITPSC